MIKLFCKLQQISVGHIVPFRKKLCVELQQVRLVNFEVLLDHDASSPFKFLIPPYLEIISCSESEVLSYKVTINLPQNV